MLPGEVGKDAKGHTVYECCLCGKRHNTFEGDSYGLKYRVCWGCMIRVVTNACKEKEQTVAGS